MGQTKLVFNPTREVRMNNLRSCFEPSINTTCSTAELQYEPCPKTDKMIGLSYIHVTYVELKNEVCS